SGIITFLENISFFYKLKRFWPPPVNGYRMVDGDLAWRNLRMGKIVSLEEFRKSRLEFQSKKLVKIANEFDEIILKHVTDRVELIDMAGLIAHRLGTLIRQLGNEET